VGTVHYLFVVSDCGAESKTQSKEFLNLCVGAVSKYQYDGFVESSFFRHIIDWNSRPTKNAIN